MASESVEDLKAHLNAALSDNVVLNDKIHKHEEEAKAVAAIIRTLEEGVVDLKAALDVASSQILVLQDRLQDQEAHEAAEEEVRSREKDFNEIRTHLVTLELENSDLASRLQKWEGDGAADVVKELEERMEALKVEFYQNQPESDVLRIVLKQVETQVETQAIKEKESEQELNNVKAELDAAKLRIESLQVKFAGACEHLQIALNGKTTLAEEVAEKKQAMEIMKSTQIARTEEQYQRHLRLYNQIKEEGDQSQKKVNELNLEREAMRREMDVVKKERDAMRKENEALQKNNANVASELRKMVKITEEACPPNP